MRIMPEKKPALSKIVFERIGKTCYNPIERSLAFQRPILEGEKINEPDEENQELAQPKESGL